MEMLGRTGWKPELHNVVHSNHFLVENLPVSKRGCQIQKDTVAITNTQMCRVCFITNCKLYSLVTFKILKKAYESLTGFLVADEEHLPSYLCTECADLLMNCARFRTKSLRAHLVLLDIVKNHGCITLELVQSVIGIQTTFSSKTKHNQKNRFDIDIEDLDKLDKFTNVPSNSRIGRIAVDIKTEIDNVYQDSINNTSDCAVDEEYSSLQEDFMNDVKAEDDMINQGSFCVSSLVDDIVIDDVKTENENMINEDEDVVVDDIIPNDNNIFNQSRRSVSSSSLDEEIVVDDVIPENNDMINQDNVSTCSSSLDEDIFVDEVIAENDMINKDSDDEGVSNEGIECSARLYEDTVCDVLKAENSGLINQNSSDDEESSDDDYMEHRHAFMFVGEDVLHPLQETRRKSKRVKDKVTLSKAKNRTKIRKQQNRKEQLSCEICPYKTNNVLQFLDHLKSHAADNTYKCRYKTVREDELEQHIWEHAEEKYSCKQCDKIFTDKDTFKVHMRIHSRKKPYSCDVCKKSFTHYSTAQGHISTHFRTESYSCDLCKKIFLLKGTYKRHMRIHIGEKPHSCNVCKRKFWYKCSVTNHMKIHSRDGTYSCEVCKIKFQRESAFTDHMIMHSANTTYTCTVCHKIFDFNSDLQRHMRLHTGEKPFSCDICHMKFSRKSTVLLHMRKHYGETPYSCRFCEKKFRRNYNLQDHLKIHSSEKPFSCNVCGKAFRHKSSFNYHMRIHSGEKPYSCDLCKQTFRLKNTLNGHLRTHSTEKPDLCNNKVLYNNLSHTHTP